MAGSALAFEENRIGVNQVLAVRTTPAGSSALPPTRAQWLAPRSQGPDPARSPELHIAIAAPSAAPEPDLGDRPTVR